MLFSRKSVLISALAVTLSACAASGSRTTPFEVAPKPAFPTTGAALNAPVYGSNANHADNLISLYFDTEWDATREGLAKWDGPVTVSIDTSDLSEYRPFLEDYLRRLRAEGGVDIRLAPSGQGAISIVTAPGDAIRSSFATAFCIVAPGRLTFNELVSSRDDPDSTDWTRIESIRNATVIIPVDAAPYQVRACLMEEIAQALGPGNDIFYLADTIFNDDGAHVTPTSFDMLALRVLYDPALSSGMSQAEAKPIVRSILDQRLPQGAGVPRGPDFRTEPDWKDAILASSAFGVPRRTQLAIAEEAVRLSQNFSSVDPRRGFSFERLGHAYLAEGEFRKAEFAFRRAIAAFELSVGDQDIRIASSRVGLAISLNGQGKAGQALTQVELALPILAAHDTDDRIRVALIERYEAQAALGHERDALQTALLSIDWALYSLGADFGELAKDRKALAEIVEGQRN